MWMVRRYFNERLGWLTLVQGTEEACRWTYRIAATRGYVVDLYDGAGLLVERSPAALTRPGDIVTRR